MTRFITFEGGDGAGKSTLIDKVTQILLQRGYSVCKTRAPGGTRLGDALRDLLLHKKDLAIGLRAELLLFLADRAQHVEEVILPALKEGKVVLCDRYNDSTEAYQSGARGLDLKTVRDLCAFACHNLQPDLTLYLDIDPREALKRISAAKDRLELEKIDFHDRIRKAFHEISKRDPQRFYLIDAAASPESVFEKAMELIDALF